MLYVLLQIQYVPIVKMALSVITKMDVPGVLVLLLQNAVKVIHKYSNSESYPFKNNNPIPLFNPHQFGPRAINLYHHDII